MSVHLQRLKLVSVHAFEILLPQNSQYCEEQGHERKEAFAYTAVETG